MVGRTASVISPFYSLLPVVDPIKEYEDDIKECAFDDVKKLKITLLNETGLYSVYCTIVVLHIHWTNVVFLVLSFIGPIVIKVLFQLSNSKRRDKVVFPKHYFSTF